MTTTAAKSARITLRAPGSTMRLVALRRPDETAISFVTVTDEAAKTTVRGMSLRHPSIAAAREALATLAQDAQKRGGQRPAVRRAFVPKPDAFGTLPAAPKGGKK